MCQQNINIQSDTETKKITGLEAATWFKYFHLWNIQKVRPSIQLNRIAAKGLYNQHKKQFDKLVQVFEKYNLDLIKYLKFYALTLGHNTYDLKTTLTSAAVFSKFVEHIQIEQQYTKIYNWYMKTVENIAEDCKRLNIQSTTEYVRYLISNKKLVNYYVCGKISQYWLASIPNFKKIIEKLDNISKDEFSIIYHRFDKLQSDVYEALKKHMTTRRSTIQITDDAILRKLITKVK